MMVSVDNAFDTPYFHGKLFRQCTTYIIRCCTNSIGSLVYGGPCTNVCVHSLMVWLDLSISGT